MKTRRRQIAVIGTFLILISAGCATKKYTRNRINERVTPLEQRTGELEETSRRNTQEIGRLGTDITEVRGRADRAQAQADAALGRADEANKRAGEAEQSVTDLRSNLDKYALQNTATVNFKFDSYELTPEAKTSLDNLAAQIRDRNNYILEVTGFADWVGSDVYNNQLTEKRADAVRRYLAEQHNIPLFRMHMLGFGELRAVADNHSSEGRAQNRRVEIRLLSRETSTATAGTTQSTQR